jgi:hypothetical protein
MRPNVTWVPEADQALLVSIIDSMGPANTLSLEQRDAIEASMRSKGHNVTWEAIR